MNFDAESLQQQIPYYLTAEDRQALVDELRAISKGGTADYFLSPSRDTFKADMLHLAWEFGLFKGPCGEKAYGETPGWSGAFFYLTELGKLVAASMLPTYVR